MKKIGFTLAEVLITLGIIGVVAAMTIPTLMNNTGDTATKTKLKKTYSMISQAYMLGLADNGGTLAGKCNNAQCLSDFILPYLKTSRNCTSADINDCWKTSSMFGMSPVYAAAPAPNFFLSTPASALSTVDGVTLGFTMVSTDCNNTTTLGIDTCGVMMVDIDGDQGQHITGKDLFGFNIQAKGIKPFGTVGDKYANVCNDINKEGCAAKYILE